MAVEFPRSQIKAIARQLGHDPGDIVEICIKPNVVIVTRLMRNRDGSVSVGLFGPNTHDVYHRVDEDDVDIPEPDADGAGTGS